MEGCAFVAPARAVGTILNSIKKHCMIVAGLWPRDEQCAKE